MGIFTQVAQTTQTSSTEEYDDSTISAEVLALQSDVADLEGDVTELQSDLVDLGAVVEGIDERLTDLGWTVESVIRRLDFDAWDITDCDFGAFADAVTATNDLGDFATEPTTTFPDSFFVEWTFYIDCGSFA
jgi:hypothetical protein